MEHDWPICRPCTRSCVGTGGQTPEHEFVAGTGSIVFYAFPQEVVNQIAERTGGRPVSVEIPNLCDGEVEIDAEGTDLPGQPLHQWRRTNTRTPDLSGPGDQARVRYFANGTRRARPSSTSESGHSPFTPAEARHGTGIVVFPETQRRPEVPKGRVTLAETPN